MFQFEHYKEIPPLLGTAAFQVIANSDIQHTLPLMNSALVEK